LKKWKQRWNLYAKATELSEKDDDIQYATFLHCIGEDVLRNFDTFTFTQAETDKIAPLLAKIIVFSTHQNKMAD